MEAIRDACLKLKTHDLSTCTLYTTAQPCPMCLGACLWANISKIYYGCNRLDTDKIGFRDDVFYKLLNNKQKIDKTLVNLDRKECLELFDYYMQKDHTLY